MARKSRKNLGQTELETAKTGACAAWGYARISVDGERSEDSIENQCDIIRDYAGGNANIDLRKIVTDLGFSGRDFDRPGYAEMMDGIKRGEVRCVIVKDLSRLGRTYIEVGELLFDTFPAYGVRFISVNDRYDSFADDAAGKKLLVLFKNLVNHMYSRDLSKKLKSSYALKCKKGELLGALPPYGYMFTKEGGGKRLKVESESAKIVKLIFEMRARGDSMIKIAGYLNRSEIPALRNHYHRLGVLTSERDAKKILWNNGYIGSLLRNEVYIGKQIQGKYDRNGKVFTVKPRGEWVVHENAHPAIVDQALFDIVQTLLGEAGEKFKKHGNKLDDNILAGKLFCSRCGKAMKRQYYRKSNNEVKYLYECRDCNTELRHTMGLEKMSRLPLEEIEEAITATIQKRIDLCVEIDALIEDVESSAVIVNKRNSLESDLKGFRRDAKKAGELLASAYTHHLDGLLDRNEFDIARKQFERDKQTAEAGAERVSKELEGCGSQMIRHNAFLSNFLNFKGFTKLDKAIVNALIKRIEVTPLSKEVAITLNFTDELEKLNTLVEESEVLRNVR